MSLSQFNFIVHLFPLCLQCGSGHKLDPLWSTIAFQMNAALSVVFQRFHPFLTSFRWPCWHFVLECTVPCCSITCVSIEFQPPMSSTLRSGDHDGWEMNVIFEMFSSTISVTADAFELSHLLWLAIVLSPDPLPPPCAPALSYWIIIWRSQLLHFARTSVLTFSHLGEWYISFMFLKIAAFDACLTL